MQNSRDLHADMPLYSVPSSYLLSTAPESIKLNNVPLIIPNLLLKYESDMMLILLKQITFNWSANVPTLLSKSACTTYRGTAGSCILNALWFIMCGHCATNISLSKICLLFFTMFLFRSSLISTLSVPKYKSLYRFHHGLHMEKNEWIYTLKCICIHLYVIHSGNLYKDLYFGTEGVW